MRVLIVPHIGETLGHLARAIPVARALMARGCSVEFASAQRGGAVLRSEGLECPFHTVSWDWSHNSCEPGGISDKFFGSILLTVTDLLALIDSRHPDFILGMPGFATAQIARSRSIRHASVLHGTHFAPLMELPHATENEEAVLRMTSKICLGPLNSAFQILASLFGLPVMDYQSFIDSEMIFIPQRELPIPPAPNRVPTNFIRASLGPPLSDGLPSVSGSCYVTFGSGNPCDVTRIVRLARNVFPSVITNTGNLPIGPLPDGVLARPFIASSDLAGKVSAVVSHGGIGTVGTFAESGAAQLILPTEIDQANMAIHAFHAGIARHIGLRDIGKRTHLGRRLPQVTDDEFLSELGRIVSPQRPYPSASGADQIADAIVGLQHEYASSSTIDTPAMELA